MGNTPLTSPKLIRAAIGVALVGLLGGAAFYWQVLRSPASIQAFVNMDIIAVRAPVAGKLVLSSEMRIGKVVSAADELGQIESHLENPRVSQLLIQEQEIATQIATLEQQGIGVEQRLAIRRRLADQFQKENDQQKTLQEKYQRALLNTAREELQRAVTRANLSASEAKRAQELFRKGVISRAALDRVQGTGSEAATEVNALKARMVQFETGLQASVFGLQLDGPRTLSEPESRLRSLQVEIVDLEQQIADLGRSLDSARKELAVVRRELGGQNSVAVRPLSPGIVWSIDVHSGENVAANGPLFQLVSCDAVWVEAFFDEADLGKIAVGQTVKVRMMYSGRHWNGIIETIRAGAGRVTVGQYVVDPPPEIARRQLPVRVATARVRVDWAGDLVPEQFCFAGNSVEVSLR